MSIPSNTSVESSSPQSAAEHQQQTVQTTGTGSQQQQQPTQPVKRSSRRANTAERRATHNAVERARRETLNGRFLDLAAMLPNLAAVRRPSKSAIVNSSIALIHNTTRARIIAARELRLLNAEANALRTELNEWRMRNNLPRVEEPVRSTDFSTLLSVEDVEMGEEMILGAAGANRRSFEGDGFGDDDNDFGEEGDEEQLISPETANPYGSFGQAVRGASMQYPPQQQQQQQQQQQLFEQQKAAMARAHQAQLAQQQAHRYSPPVIQQPQVHHQHSQSQPTMMFPADLYTSPTNEMYQAASWSQKAITTLTPPGSAHGQTKASQYANTANSAFLSGHQQGMFKPVYNNGAGFLGVGEDDQSDGSSHFSGVSDMGSLVDQPFSFGLSSNTPTPMNNAAFNMGMMGYGQMNMGMMQLPPSPPHTGSPASSQVQSRRPSVNISSGGSAKSSPGPSPIPNQYGMPLMI